MRTISHLVPVACAALLACTPAPAKGPVHDPSNGPMPDFSLRDVNVSSPTYWELVSPRDYLQQISAWYFGHAT